MPGGFVSAAHRIAKQAREAAAAQKEKVTPAKVEQSCAEAASRGELLTSHAMTSMNLENENEIDYQYPGYIVRAKNTFIDVTPKSSMIRSRSCMAMFESCNFIDSSVKPSDRVCATPSTTCSSTSGDSNRGPFALSLGRRASYDDLDSGGSDNEGDNEAFVAELFQKYLVNTDNSGMTLMWHGLTTKYQMKPDLIRIIEDIDAQGVAYLYLPLNHWEKSSGKFRISSGKCRNKGYAFVHFKTAANAEEFTRKLSEYTFESRRPRTTLAAHQGVSLNLTQLVTAPQKRTAAGAIYLPNAMGKFECATIASLRKLYEEMGNGK
jgi:hypothetical protein